jgi:hypothetical protein
MVFLSLSWESHDSLSGRTTKRDQIRSKEPFLKGKDKWCPVSSTAGPERWLCLEMTTWTTPPINFQAMSKIMGLGRAEVPWMVRFSHT